MIIQPIEVIQNNYGYNLVFNLQDGNGNAQNLTGATLQILVQDGQDPKSTLLFQAAMVTDNAATGICHYLVAVGNFPQPGAFNYQIQATYSGEVITWGTYLIVVKPALPQLNN